MRPTAPAGGLARDTHRAECALSAAPIRKGINEEKSEPRYIPNEPSISSTDEPRVENYLVQKKSLGQRKERLPEFWPVVTNQANIQ